MSNDPKSVTLRACRAMLRPIVRILLRNGVIWKEFAELAKSVYVDVAGKDYGISGRQTNASRVSILTGLTRREVKKQRDLVAAGMPAADRMSNITRLLSGWYQDPDFLGPDGQPASLSRDGEGQSFDRLHRLYGGDIPAVAMLKELLKAGAVQQLDDGRLQPISRYYMPDPQDPEAMLRAGSVFNDLGATVAWNLARDEEQQSRFEGRATEATVPKRHARAFGEFIEREGQSFLERIDEWLTRHRVGEKDKTPVQRLGVGVYLIQDDAKDSGKDNRGKDK
ncbi:MAG: DUF6502 family protein [Gammaproteobacteria bacterium]